MRYIIYPYKMSSQSAKELQKGLQEKGKKALRVYPDRNYRYQEGDVIINWGNSVCPDWNYQTIYNLPGVVYDAANKLATFEVLLDAVIPTPWFTTNKTNTIGWLQAGHKVYCRTVLNGHGGAGIVVVNPGEGLPDAPLYTVGFQKSREYRVHVWGGSVIHVQEKKKREGTGVRSDCDVWNHSNDFVFCQQEVECPEEVKQLGIDAVNALRLDFGAVDIGWKRNGECVVFEVNTAPGISGTTVNKYVEAILNDA